MAFMELMTDPSYYPASSTWHVMPMLMGPDRRIGWISAEDLGAIYAGFFADPERYVGADLTLMSDVRSLDECAALWKQVMGKARPRLPMPVFLFKLFVGDDLVKMWSWLRTGEVSLDTSTTRDLWPEARTVEAWLRERAAT